MPTYVSLVSFTEQGIKNFKETTDRAAAASEAAAKMGGRIKDIYWTLGVHDIVVVSEFPDDQTGLAFLLSIGALGNVRTQTLKAFTAEEMTEVIAKTS